MGNFILIAAALGAGLALRRLRSLPNEMARALNTFVIYISFPALVLTQVPSLLAHVQWSPEFFIACSMAWLQLLVAAGIFVPLGRIRRWSRATTGALILTAGLANTSFVGFPMLEALLGPQAITIAILVDQLGSFLVLATVGIVCASLYSGSRPTPREIARRVLTFPPFLALLGGTLLHLLAPTLLSALFVPLEKLANTLVPLALVSVGLQLSFERSALVSRSLALSLGLVFKLVLAPAVFTVLYYVVIGSQSDASLVTVLESAMAPMITAAIVAADFNLDTELANLMVGIGTPLSLVTVVLWHRLLTGTWH